MNMLQLLGGVAAAGVIAAGTTALTGSGVIRTGTALDTVVGGTVTQNITGATITDVTYGYLDAAQTQTNSIAITVAGAGGKFLTATPGGGAYGGTPAVADEWKCTGGQVTPLYAATGPKVQIPVAPSSIITCVPSDSTNTHATANRFYAGLSTLQIAVTDS